MAKPTVLEAFFKKYRDAIQSNADFRTSLNKESNHYLQEDIKNLKSQIALVDSKLEQQFNTKYAQALQTLVSKGMSDLTFTRISGVLKTNFLNNFTELKSLGIDVGHLYANLTVASKAKAQEKIFGNKLEIKENREIESLSAEDLKDISKTLALISTYTNTLERLDKVQNRVELIKFLKRSPSFKKVAGSSDLSTLSGINSTINNVFSFKGSKGFSDLGKELLSEAIVNIESNTTMEFSRKITASDKGVAVTFEVAAFNRFKGTLAKAIQGQATEYLDTLMKNPNGLPKELNKSLEKSLVGEFTKKDLLELFPNVTASKSLVQVIEDIVVGTISTGKSTPYSATKILNNQKPIIQKTTIKLPKMDLKPPKVRISPTIRSRRGQFISPVSIKNLLNSKLAQQIQHNMGKGRARNVLNYRTGRFANSAEVVQVTNRDGAITAFYSYMKNPYATFAPGGAQSNPGSRDPNLLIQTSIRQLAAGIMANRLKVVPV
jgi:hypothetical protein